MSEFISIPLRISQGRNHPAFEKEEGNLEKCVDNILDLIVFTPKGSFIADPEFGFEYWNHEFSNIDVREFNNSYIGMMSAQPVNTEISRKKCESSIKDSILAYEPKLLKPEVKIELDINNRLRKRKSQSKYEMRILITGYIDDGLGISRPYEKKISFMVEPIAKKFNI